MFSGLGSEPEYQGGGAHVEPGVRTSLVDIMETKDSSHVVVEMAGITREDVSLGISGAVLNIKARNEDRKVFRTCGTACQGALGMGIGFR